MKFEYHEPRSIADAISLANSLDGITRWLAGGTELLPKLKQRALRVEHLINLKRIPELMEIHQNKSGVRIGPLTTLEELAASNAVGRGFSALSEAAGSVASPNIRRAATIGGNLCQAPNCLYFIHRRLWRLPECHAAGGSLCNAVKGARRCVAMSPIDTAPALIALEAKLEIEGFVKKTLPLEAFFISSGITALGKNDMITSIVIPDTPLPNGSAYLKYSQRKTIDYGIVSVGVRLVLEPREGHCLEVRVALGGIDTVPVRARKIEEALTGKMITMDIISKAADLAFMMGRPWSDIHASNDYRRHLARLFVRRALSLAFTRAKAAA